MFARASRAAQRGGFFLTMGLMALFFGVVGGGVVYVLDQSNEAGRRDMANFEAKILDPHSQLSDEEIERARVAPYQAAQRAGAAAGVLNTVTNIGTPDVGTAVGVGADVAIGKMMDRGLADAPVPTGSATLPADILGAMPCAATTLPFCTTPAACRAAGGHWWSDNLCRSKPEPVCASDRLNHCRTPAACTAVGGSWIDDLCTRPGCWQFIDTQRIEPALGTGYSGTATAVGNLISLTSHPSDPKWSHLLTAVEFTWSFDGADPVDGQPDLYCPQQTITGWAQMRNTGNQLVRSGYSPNAYLSLFVGSGAGHWTSVWALSSAELPAPGEAVKRAFLPGLKAPPGSAGQTMTIVAAGHAGRTVEYRYRFVMIRQP
ncbi:MAG: hypothetical protein HY855_04520 [Burkholderiales bacterium]|nr:hypothetical protein [Burkholderiales bacterium]